MQTKMKIKTGIGLLMTALLLLLMAYQITGLYLFGSVTSTGTQNDADSNGKVLSVTGWSGLFCLFGGKGPDSEIETNVLGCTGMTSRNVRRGKEKYQDQAKYYKYSS